MDTGKGYFRPMLATAVVLVQLIMTQVVTFLSSVVFPGMVDYQRTRPVVFMVLLGVSFAAGVFLPGWLALKLRWISAEPKTWLRLMATLTGAFLPLILALILYGELEAGNPFFLVSILASLLGFYLPGWIGKK